MKTKKESWFDFNRGNFQKKNQISVKKFPKWEFGSNPTKSSLSEFSYFHACCSHYFKYDFYKFAKHCIQMTNKKNPLSVYTYSPEHLSPILYFKSKKDTVRNIYHVGGRGGRGQKKKLHSLSRGVMSRLSVWNREGSFCYENEINLNVKR